MSQLVAKIVAYASQAWSKWGLIVEWVSRNTKPIIALLVLGNLFGMIAPDTATALRDAVLSVVGL